MQVTSFEVGFADAEEVDMDKVRPVEVGVPLTRLGAHVDSLAVALVDTPAEEPVDMPAEVFVDTPAEMLVEAPADQLPLR